MEFEIDFNNETDDATLIAIGAKKTPIAFDSTIAYTINMITLNSFQELKELLDKVNELKGDEYAAIISFDQPTIYLDANV